MKPSRDQKDGGAGGGNTGGEGKENTKSKCKDRKEDRKEAGRDRMLGENKAESEAGSRIEIRAESKVGSKVESKAGKIDEIDRDLRALSALLSSEADRINKIAVWKLLRKISYRIRLRFAYPSAELLLPHQAREIVVLLGRASDFLIRDPAIARESANLIKLACNQILEPDVYRKGMSLICRLSYPLQNLYGFEGAQGHFMDFGQSLDRADERYKAEDGL